ncbi:kelch repeat-containing protein [Amycolatopsis sp. NPDC049688]|uniref:Kelch repeat-containing protein n=1 Tax=Amycolatopsis sp. NPDC049688 TaxID=3154733 RepID=UPI00342D7133
MTAISPAATGAWTTTDELPTPGSWGGQHDGPVVLGDGKVLAAGGAGATGGPLNRVARYDPAAGTWATTGNLLTARRLHSVTLLADGKVLVAGGTSVGSAQFPPPGLAAAEVYDPAAGTWTSTGNLHTGRWGHSATVLADGSVLVAGGSAVRSSQSLTALRTAERWDPGSGHWTEVGPMTDARSGHTAVRLPNGTVLVAGGSVPTGRNTDAALAFCELFDPGDGSWAPTGSLTVPRACHQATLAGTTVLATGGTAPGPRGDGTFDPFARATAEIYQQATGLWTATDSMPAGRELHRAVAMSADRILVVGGTDGVTDTAGFASALLYDVSDGSWEEATGLDAGRWSFGAAKLAGQKVLVTGGVARSGQAGSALAASTEVFDATGPTP